MAGEQTTLYLPQRSADEINRERLEIAVCEFNEELDPLKRVALHKEISQLRVVLGVKP